MRTGIARLLVVALLGSSVAAIDPIVPATVLADCAEHGRSVRTPEDAQGLAFIGVYDTQGDTPDGNLWVRFTVEQALKGHIKPGPVRLKTFVCDPTLLLPGVRYVVSTSARPGHGMTSYGNSIAILDAVRAVDPRFADLPGAEDAQRQGRYDAVLAGSWISVIDTFGQLAAIAPGPAVDDPWYGLGGSVVQVMLVADCVTEDVFSYLADPAKGDPCRWRHTWLYRVSGSGEVILLFDEGSEEAQ